MADDGYRCSVVCHDRRAVGGAGAGGRVMATPTYRWFANDFSNGCLDDGFEQHKGPGRGDAPVPLAPLVGRPV